MNLDFVVKVQFIVEDVVCVVFAAVPSTQQYCHKSVDGLCRYRVLFMKWHQTHHKIILSGWMSTCTSLGFWTEKLIVTYFFLSYHSATAGWLRRHIKLLILKCDFKKLKQVHVDVFTFQNSNRDWQYLPLIWPNNLGLVHSYSWWNLRRDGTIMTLNHRKVKSAWLLRSAVCTSTTARPWRLYLDQLVSAAGSRLSHRPLLWPL